MIPVEEKYEFELPQEVKDKIEHAENRHVLIGEGALQDLKPVRITAKRYLAVKRAMDIALSTVGLLVLLVPIAVISAIIYADDPGGVFFRQNRVGRDGKLFKLYKFRTMKRETPKYLSTSEMKDAHTYITRVGRFLRKYSLDELPQLFNVFKGDMSLVGPRPLIADEYEIHQMRMRFGVYAIRPGVTGLAQINGRDTVTPADKVRWDVRYMEELGLLTDLRILLTTIPKILGSDGVVEGSSTKQ